MRCLFWVMRMVWQGGSGVGGTKIPMSCVEGIVLERGLREALGSFQIHGISISVYGLGMWFRGSFSPEPSQHQLDSMGLCCWADSDSPQRVWSAVCWLVGWVAVCWLSAGWQASCWVAGWLLAGWLVAGWLAGWLAAGWLGGRWLSGSLAG